MPTGGQVSEEEAEEILAEHKLVTANLVWIGEGRRLKLEAMVLGIDSGRILSLRANVGVRNRSVALLYKNVRIRGYCTSRNHLNPGRVLIREPHKHRYDESNGDREAYVPNDIRFGNINEELMDFLIECNIEFRGTYQQVLIPKM